MKTFKFLTKMLVLSIFIASFYSCSVSTDNNSDDCLSLKKSRLHFIGDTPNILSDSLHSIAERYLNVNAPMHEPTPTITELTNPNDRLKECVEHDVEGFKSGGEYFTDGAIAGTIVGTVGGSFFPELGGPEFCGWVMENIGKFIGALVDAGVASSEFYKDSMNYNNLTILSGDGISITHPLQQYDFSIFKFGDIGYFHNYIIDTYLQTNNDFSHDIAQFTEEIGLIFANYLDITLTQEYIQILINSTDAYFTGQQDQSFSEYNDFIYSFIQNLIDIPETQRYTFTTECMLLIEDMVVDNDLLFYLEGSISVAFYSSILWIIPDFENII